MDRTGYGLKKHHSMNVLLEGGRHEGPYDARGESRLFWMLGKGLRFLKRRTELLGRPHDPALQSEKKTCVFGSTGRGRAKRYKSSIDDLRTNIPV